jgi:hypothetical protein
MSFLNTVAEDYRKNDYINGTQSTREVLANPHKMFVEKLDKMRSLGRTK